MSESCTHAHTVLYNIGLETHEHSSISQSTELQTLRAAKYIKSRMKSKIVIAGVCLLVILAIAECGFDFVSTASPKQVDDCGNIFDNTTDLGQCFDYAYYSDYDSFCDDSDCEEIVAEWFTCIGGDPADYKLEDVCDAAVAVGSISTITAILVAIVAALT